MNKTMTLKEAITYLLDEFHLEDKVYNVRSRSMEEDRSFAGNSWEHPAVLKFAEACEALKDARERKDL